MYSLTRFDCNVCSLWLTLLLTHCSKLPCFTLVIVELLVCLVGSLHRKKELELWLKDREAKRKAEDKEKRKPFYVGSRNAVASTNPFSVTGHTCCHGTRTTLPSNATQTQDPPMAKKVKPKTKPVLKEPSQPSRCDVFACAGLSNIFHLSQNEILKRNFCISLYFVPINQHICTHCIIRSTII